MCRLPPPLIGNGLQEGYRWLLPLHGGNFSREGAQELVRSWPNQTSLAPPAPHGEPPAAGSAMPQPGKQGHGAQTAPVGAHDTAAAGLGLSPGKPGKASGTSRHFQSKGATGGAVPATSGGGEL